jgi:hypothetical protein
MKFASLKKWALAFLVLLLLFLFLFFSFVYKEKTIPRDGIYNLKEHGFCICKNTLPVEKAEKYRELCIQGDYKRAKEELIKEPELVELKDNILGPDYEYQDYIWVIQRSSVHTCHRDNNGDFFNENQKHPSYTILVYLEPAEKCLGVIPNSHTHIYANSVNFADPVEHLLCDCGDAILFNANLIHVGAINSKEDNLRIQLKLTHRDDIAAIGYYENFHKILNQPNELPVALRKMQKRASCMVPLLSDWTQSENIRTARGSDNGVEIGLPQQIFSTLFYGNSDYYNLKNAF